MFLAAPHSQHEETLSENDVWEKDIDHIKDQSYKY